MTLIAWSLLATALGLTLICAAIKHADDRRAIEQGEDIETPKQWLGLAPDTTLDDLTTDTSDDAMVPFEADFWRPTYDISEDQ